MREIMEMGTVSSRGQIAIPSKIRKQLQLKEGSKVVFLSNKEGIIIKKANKETWEELTKPIREAIAKTDLKPEDINGIIHRARKSWK